MGRDERLREAAWEFVKPLCGEIDFKGHFLRGQSVHMDWLHFKLQESLLSWVLLIEHARKLSPVSDDIKDMMSKYPLISSIDCNVCGEYITLVCDGESLHGRELRGRSFQEMTPCAYPDGILSEFELKVPSGKIVVFDDLRPFFPGLKKPYSQGTSVQHQLGRSRKTALYAEHGLAHGFVSNTSPRVFRKGDRFVLARWYEDDSPWGEKVASITTDLWWYSIADAEDIRRRDEEHHPPDAYKNWDTVEVKPGVYKFRQDHNIDPEEAHEKVLVEFWWDRPIS